MADNEIKEGDQVSWQWGGGAPGGKAVEVAKEGEISVTSHRGNEIKKNADPENPAVHIARSGNDVVKRASELDVEKEGPNHKEGGESKEEKKDDEKKDDEKKDDKEEEKKETNGDAKAGEKRKADESAEEKKDEEDGDAKKQKTDEAKENGDKPASKKKGRPAKKDANGETAPKKETKKKEPKKAATATGEPRRSGRNRS